MAGEDPFRLQRFIDAQEPHIEDVLTELSAGRKRTHWMWFVFPQLRGLGRSSTAEFYGLGSLAEARAYLAHPVLGARLRDCTRRVLAVDGSSPNRIFGSPDDLKFHSSMTLFARADESAANVFTRALERFWNGTADAATQRLLANG